MHWDHQIRRGLFLSPKPRHTRGVLATCRRKEKVNIVWQLLLGGILALLLSTIASHVYYDTRPFVVEHTVPIIPHAADNGFPSDHTLLTSFIGFTIYLHSRAVGGVLLLIALLVGIARVAARIHHPITSWAPLSSPCYPLRSWCSCLGGGALYGLCIQRTKALRRADENRCCSALAAHFLLQILECFVR